MARTPSSSASPAVLRRQLAGRLRELRLQAGLTLEDVGAHLLVDPSKISRLETGNRPAGMRDVRDLGRLYSVSADELEHLLALARDSRQSSIWRQFGSAVSDHAELEEDATSIAHYETSLIPGLLQTEEYARAVTAGVFPDTADVDRERMVQGRLARQTVLVGRGRPRLSYVLDEAALLRKVGGPGTLKQQLMALLDRGRLPGIDLRIISVDAGAHPGMDTAFEILSVPGVSDVVYLEGYAGVFFLRKPADVARYSTAFRHLQHLALGKSDSLALVRARAAELPEG